MNGKTMDERVTDLEKLAESLAPLPARMEAVEGRLGVVDMRLGAVETRLSTVESQIVQLRTEMHVEFSAVRVRWRTAFRRCGRSCGPTSPRVELVLSRAHPTETATRDARAARGSHQAHRAHRRGPSARRMKTAPSYRPCAVQPRAAAGVVHPREHAARTGACRAGDGARLPPDCRDRLDRGGPGLVGGGLPARHRPDPRRGLSPAWRRRDAEVRDAARPARPLCAGRRDGRATTLRSTQRWCITA